MPSVHPLPVFLMASPCLSPFVLSPLAALGFFLLFEQLPRSFLKAFQLVFPAVWNTDHPSSPTIMRKIFLYHQSPSLFPTTLLYFSMENLLLSRNELAYSISLLSISLLQWDLALFYLLVYS
jgi:hypothetical protein